MPTDYAAQLASLTSPLSWRTMSDASSIANGAQWFGSWVNMSPLSQYEVRFSRDARGMVLLSGLVTGGNMGENVFRLPLGFRPQMWQYRSVDAYKSFGELMFALDGLVTYRTGLTTPAWVSLDGITYIGA